MLPSLVLSCALGVPALETPAEWVRELGGDDPAVARAALLACEPADALPPLVDCILTAEPDHAWRAGGVVRALAREGTRDRAWRDGVKALAAFAVDSEAPAVNRTVAALSLRGVGSAGKPVCAELVSLLTGSDLASIRLGATLACGGLDKSAALPLKKELRGEGLMKTLLASSAVACLGTDGSKVRSTLVGLIEDDESLTAFLTCRSNRFSLERVAGAKATEKPFEERLSHARGRVWRGGGGGLNFGGIMPQEVEAFVTMFTAETRRAMPDLAKMSLPTAFEASMNGSYFTVADGTQGLAEHATRVILELHEGLAEDAFESWSDWMAKAEPVSNLLAFLDDIDTHVER